MGTARVVGIIQARMGSKRLPGKSMADLAGRPLVWHVIERVKRSRTLDDIVLATPRCTEDDVLTEVAEACGIKTFRGAENDLMDRYYQAATAFGAEVVVRICADNPVIEPNEIDRIVVYHQHNGRQFSSNLSNIQNNGYPDGIGAEAFNLITLEEAWKLATDPGHREHPHTYFYDHPEQYVMGTVQCPTEFRRPELKLDVNVLEELQFVRAIYEYWYPKKPQFTILDIIDWYDNVYRGPHPQV